jgi:outer membrane protein assembly factor BamE
MKRLALRMIFVAGSTLLAGGCVYRMSIQQGNYLVTESVSQLKEGMTRSQVRFLLGTPMVPDAFNDERWDYYYFYSSKYFKEPLKRRLTVYFVDEKVARYENQGVPTQTDLDQMERDLKKAQADTQKKKSLWQRMFGRDTPPSDTATTSSGSKIEQEASKPPDPVPPSAPLPAPAGTASDPT